MYTYILLLDQNVCQSKFDHVKRSQLLTSHTRMSTNARGVSTTSWCVRLNVGIKVMRLCKLNGSASSLSVVYSGLKNKIFGRKYLYSKFIITLLLLHCTIRIMSFKIY